MSGVFLGDEVRKVGMKAIKHEAKCAGVGFGSGDKIDF
jgi:hypothetical protein